MQSVRFFLTDSLRIYPVFILIYVVGGLACTLMTGKKLKQLSFTIINITGCLYLSSGILYQNLKGDLERNKLIFLILAVFTIYLLFVCFEYYLIFLFAERKDKSSWLAFLAPIFSLIAVKYLPGDYNPLGLFLSGSQIVPGFGVFVGISYMAFRLSYLVLEIKNETVKRPGFLEFFCFAFFVPTFIVGPISPYGVFARNLYAPDRAITPVARSALRIIIGAVKYQFLANLFNQLSYEGLLLDGNPHTFIDLCVAAVAYYFYLYLNFSGFCDMGIGAAGLMGISVKENFDNPFAARNVKDFWNRWHITLSEYMRTVVFTPLSKIFVYLLGTKRINHAIALAIFLVFLLIGVWHGVGWNYFFFGLFHAVGVVVTHYYTIILKKVLADRFPDYGKSVIIRSIATAITFIYITASFFLFANSLDGIKKIIEVIQ